MIPKYEIHIGKKNVVNEGALQERPDITIIISEEQRAIIEKFASTERDEDMTLIYTINKVRFKIVDHFPMPLPTPPTP